MVPRASRRLSTHDIAKVLLLLHTLGVLEAQLLVALSLRRPR